MPEREITPWAHPGWLAWNEHAVEIQVAGFLQGMVAEMAASSGQLVVLETGTGQGYVTRRIATEMSAQRDQLICFESDPEWRNAMIDREWAYGFFDGWEPNHVLGDPRDWASTLEDDIMSGRFLSWRPTPDSLQYQAADLTILDSMDPLRMGELCMWAALAKPGSYLFLHDAGNGHPSWDGHYTLGQLVRTLQLPGKWLENPRGAFVARQDHEAVEPWVDDLWRSILERVYSSEYENPTA